MNDGHARVVVIGSEAHVVGFQVCADSSSAARDFFCCSGDSVWYGGAFSSLAGGFSATAEVIFTPPVIFFVSSEVFSAPAVIVFVRSEQNFVPPVQNPAPTEQRLVPHELRFVPLLQKLVPEGLRESTG
jgi:hypothetical protein